MFLMGWRRIRHFYTKCGLRDIAEDKNQRERKVCVWERTEKAMKSVLMCHRKFM